MNMKIHNIITKSRANGPGIRYTIWVQGCSIHCKGCANVHIWDPSKGYFLPINEIVKQVEALKNEIDGITLTGGEPLDQTNIIELSKRLFSITSVFLATGYTLKQITDKGLAKVLVYTDIICTGPFELDKICKGEWKGSSNQDVKGLTERGRVLLKKPVIKKEIIIDTVGNAIETGFS